MTKDIKVKIRVLSNGGLLIASVGEISFEVETTPEESRKLAEAVLRLQTKAASDAR